VPYLPDVCGTLPGRWEICRDIEGYTSIEDCIHGAFGASRLCASGRRKHMHQGEVEGGKLRLKSQPVALHTVSSSRHSGAKSHFGGRRERKWGRP
jgi:hypothetical protein